MAEKCVQPRMEPWGTLALTGHSCEDFPSRTTCSRLLLKKKNPSTTEKKEQKRTK